MFMSREVKGTHISLTYPKNKCNFTWPFENIEFTEHLRCTSVTSLLFDSNGNADFPFANKSNNTNPFLEIDLESALMCRN